jgi:glycosyltransferase involved in cell wall biosynthesis
VIALAKMFRTKIVYHFHNKGISQKQDGHIDNLIYKYMFRNTHVILLSRLLYPDVQKYVLKENVFYCANGIPNDKSSSILKQNQGSSEEVHLLFLSNLIASKGMMDLLKACKAILDKGIRFKCTFVGNIGDVSEDKFHTFVHQLGLNENVRYAGKKYGDEKSKEFSKADIFVHPTLEDCFPLVILEAMQYSLPVVSTYEGGIPELVEDGKTGFLVPKNNVVALAEKLIVLINSKNLRVQMGKAGRQKYEQQFTEEIFEKRFSEQLNKIILKHA